MCHFTSIWTPIFGIRWYYARFIPTIEIHILVRHLRVKMVPLIPKQWRRLLTDHTQKWLQTNHWNQLKWYCTQFAVIFASKKIYSKSRSLNSLGTPAWMSLEWDLYPEYTINGLLTWCNIKLILPNLSLVFNILRRQDQLQSRHMSVNTCA